jgi:pimeloyl-ACP methyl ester carboxylesterase
MRKGHSRFARTLRRVNTRSAASMVTLQEGYRMQRMLGANRLVLRRALTRMMPTADAGAVQFEALLDDAARIPPEAVVGFLQALDVWNVEGDLAALDVPTLILAGGKDELVPTRELEGMAQALRHGELVVWPDVGHSPQLERPDEFLGLLIVSAVRSRRTAWARALRRIAARLNPFLPSRPQSSPALS